MPNEPRRCLARASISDSTGVGYRAISAYIGNNLIRDTFTGKTGILTGQAGEEGPTGALWDDSYSHGAFATAPTMGSHACASGSINNGSGTYTVPNNFIDCGTDSAFVSMTFMLPAALTAAATPGILLRCNAGGLANSPRYTTYTEPGVSNNGFPAWDYCWNINTNASTTVTFNVNFNGQVVAILAPSTSLTVAPNDWILAEVWIRGAGTPANPTLLDMWINGFKCIPSGAQPVDQAGVAVSASGTVSATSDPFVGQTRMGFYQTAGAYAAPTYSLIDDFFVTNVPSSPGGTAGINTGTTDLIANNNLNLAPIVAGAEIPWKMRWSRVRSPSSAQPNGFRIGLNDDSNNIVYYSPADLNPTAADNGYIQAIAGSGVSVTDVHLFATTTGLSNGIAASGMFRLRAHMLSYNSTTSTLQWSVDSENNGIQAQTGVTGAPYYAPGYFVASDTVAAPTFPTGTKTFGDSFTVTTATTTRPIRAAASPSIVLSVSGATVNTGDTTTAWTASSPATTSTTDLADGDFPASLNSVTVAMNSNVSSALNNDPYNVWTGTPSGVISNSGKTVTWSSAFSVDPRITVEHYMQLDDATFGTPPDGVTDLSHNVNARLASNIGFVGERFTNANGVGLNGINYNRSLRDIGHLASELAGDSPTSTTKGGALGWSPSWTSWTSSLPGGSYMHIITLNGTASGLGVNTSSNFSLLAVNPNIRILCGLDIPSDTADADHWMPGLPLLIGLVAIDFANDQEAALDTSPAPSALIGRFNVSLGRAEYLGSNYNWYALSSGAAYEFPLAQSAGDANVWIATFTSAQTTNFSYDGLIMIGKAYINGTPYTGPATLEVTGNKNKHSAYGFDGAGFLGLASYK